MVWRHWEKGVVRHKKKVEEQKKERGAKEERKRETWLSSEWQNCNIIQDRKRMKSLTNECILQGSRTTVSV